MVQEPQRTQDVFLIIMLRSVRKTHRGDDVLAIQQGLNQRLNNLVPPIPNLKRRDDGLFVGEDGKFGGETESVVKAFQRRMKLTDDGVVGHDTRKALFPLGLATIDIFMLRMPQLRVPGLGQPGGLGQLSPRTICTFLHELSSRRRTARRRC
jgi:peptidoglycan hydrolase-like protein with peptidoglycan-binding domain